ncbi:MAG: replicative DNA helicase [Planctomycetota bacterium]
MADEKLLEKTPPRDLEAEMSTLGAILLDPDTLHDIAQLLTADDFYATSHKVIYQAMLALLDQSSAIDVVILKNTLHQAGQLEAVGGPDYLRGSPNRCRRRRTPATMHRSSSRRAQLRNLIKCATEILRRAYQDTDDVTTVLEESEQQIFALTKSGARSETIEIRDVLRNVMEVIDAQHSGRGSMLGAPTGFRDLDEKLSGLHGGQMIVIAARPSMGKTSLALNIAENFGMNGKGVLVFSLEMATAQIAQNMLCSNARVDVHKVRRGLLDTDAFARLVNAAGRLSAAPIFIDDSAGMSMLQIRARRRRVHAAHHVGLVVVDYLQLVSSPSAESRQQEITQISMGMKHMARELDVPVIAISQLNRGVDAREDHRPRMSDLRESGSIEQDADVVLFLFRPDYYEPDRPELQGRAELIVAKQRSGPTGNIPLVFLPYCMRFGDATPLDYRG